MNIGKINGVFFGGKIKVHAYDGNIYGEKTIDTDNITNIGYSDKSGRTNISVNNGNRCKNYNTPHNSGVFHHLMIINAYNAACGRNVTIDVPESSRK